VIRLVACLVGALVVTAVALYLIGLAVVNLRVG
jgi:hypothetical protein